MGRRGVVRLLEVAFRRWWVVLLPMVLFGAAGVFLSLGGDQRYESFAVLRVQDETVLSGLTGQTSSFTWETPAQVTSRRLNEMLSTDAFTAAVASAAGVDDASVPGLLTLDDVRDAIGASPNGENLVVVTAQTRDPAASQRLTQAAIDEFVQTVVDSVLAESAAAESYFTELLSRYEAEAADAVAALEEYLLTHPEPLEGDRPTEEEVEIARLNRAVEIADDKVQGARQSLEGAQLAAEQTLADTQQRLSVIDEPTLPEQPLGSMKEKATTVAIFVLLGIFVALSGLLLLLVTDRTLRRPEDVRDRLGVDVLGTVPETRWTDPKRLRSAGPLEARAQPETRSTVEVQA